MDIVAQNPGIGSFEDMSRDNRLALLSRMKSRGSNDVYLVDLSSKKEVNLTSHDGPGEFAGRFSHDAKTVYLASNKDRDLEAFAKEKRRQRRGRDNRRTGHASGVDLEHSGKIRTGVCIPVFRSRKRPCGFNA